MNLVWRRCEEGKRWASPHEVPSVHHQRTPTTETEALTLLDLLEEAILGLQLREGERMAYELIRFHWQRSAGRLEDGYTVIDGLATGNLGAALAACTAIRVRFTPQAEQAAAPAA